MWCKLEQYQMNWIIDNQPKIRADLYQGLKDAMQAKDVQNIGTKRIILPGSVQGSQRWYNKRYRDAITIALKVGMPSLFITFTCNPYWP